MNISNTDDLVNEILALWEEEIKDDATVIKKIQSKFNITEDDAALALELTRTGLFRAGVISKTHYYPKNNLAKNAIVNSALKIGLTQLGCPELYTNASKANKPWWKFW